MNILFIDDDVKRNLPLIRNLEYGQGWKVEQVKTPKSALETLRQENESKSFDLILLDMMMPPDESVDIERSDLGQSTGLLLIDKIHEITKGKIPIIVLSARQDLQEKLRDDKRVKAYLKKIMSEREVISTIKEVMESR